MSNSQLWKRLGVRDMAIFVSHVGSYFSNIGEFEVYEGIWGYVGAFGGI